MNNPVLVRNLSALSPYNICSSPEFPENKLRWNIHMFSSDSTYPLISCAVIACTFYYHEQASLTDIGTHKDFVLLRCHVAYGGSLLPAFRDSLPAPFPFAKQSRTVVRSQRREGIEYSTAKAWNLAQICNVNNSSTVISKKAWKFCPVLYLHSTSRNKHTSVVLYGRWLRLELKMSLSTSRRHTAGA
jgi:hypothetical protein